MTLGMVDGGRPQEQRGQHTQATKGSRHELEAECPASACKTPELEDGHEAEADTGPGAQNHLEMESVLLEILT